MHSSPSHYQQLQPEERVTIASLTQQNHSVRAIARQLRRSPATISRELRRNACSFGYGSARAQCQTSQRRCSGRPAIKLHPSTSRRSCAPAAPDSMSEANRVHGTSATKQPPASAFNLVLKYPLWTVNCVANTGRSRGRPDRRNRGLGSTGEDARRPSARQLLSRIFRSWSTPQRTLEPETSAPAP